MYIVNVVSIIFNFKIFRILNFKFKILNILNIVFNYIYVKSFFFYFWRIVIYL